MPLDASDRIRRIQETVLYTGYYIKNPSTNFSTCSVAQTSSNNRAFNTYEYKNQIYQGRSYFSTCISPR